MTDLSTLDGLDWLVVARNEIQSLMLELYNKRPKQEPDEMGDWHSLVGAAFSLWRAVFLVHEADLTREINLPKHAEEFLLKVIETNNISFGDDRSCRSWSSGYYLNNARYRLKALKGYPLEEIERNDKLKERWNETFIKLKEALGGSSSRE
jgi:hypothetical protein